MRINWQKSLDRAKTLVYNKNHKGHITKNERNNLCQK